MRHKYLALCALAVSLSGIQAARAQPQDAGQPRAGIALTPEQAQEFQIREATERLKRLEEEQATERLSATAMLRQLDYALNEGDLALAMQCVESNTDRGALLRRLATGTRRAYGTRSFTLLPLFEAEPTGKDEFEARVAIVLKRNDPLEIEDAALNDRATSIESVTLRRGADRQWKIVPRPAPAAAEGTGEAATTQFATFEARVKAAQSEPDGFLNSWARALSQPRALSMQAVSRVSMSNVKQLMLGIMQFAQDNDVKLAFTAENFQTKIMPYVKSNAIFLAPSLGEDEPFAYALNPNILGKGLGAFAEPARTVALYEAGPDGKLLARFDGKVVIGFVDGHVKLTSPQEAETLIWKP